MWGAWLRQVKQQPDLDTRCTDARCWPTAGTAVHPQSSISYSIIGTGIGGTAAWSDAAGLPGAIVSTGYLMLVPSPLLRMGATELHALLVLSSIRVKIIQLHASGGHLPSGNDFSYCAAASVICVADRHRNAHALPTVLVIQRSQLLVRRQ